MLLSACADSRDPLPCKMVRPDDLKMECREIALEYISNTTVATGKIDKNNDDDVQDVVVGGLIWPGLADFKNADGTEGNALLDRNIRLFEIATMLKCDTSQWPQQPQRYD